MCINRQTLETGNSVKLLGTVRPFVYYVSVGGGGFQKSVVYQNFTLPQSNYSMKIVLPSLPLPPPLAIAIFKIGH